MDETSTPLSQVSNPSHGLQLLRRQVFAEAGKIQSILGRACEDQEHKVLPLGGSGRAPLRIAGPPTAFIAQVHYLATDQQGNPSEHRKSCNRK